MPEPSVEPITYAYRPTAMSSPRAFRLTDTGIEWEAGRSSGSARYEAIKRVRMLFRPANMQSQRFVTEIWPRNGAKLSIVSTNAKGLFEFARQDNEYRQFVNELHRRLSGKSRDTMFDAGFARPIFWFAVVLFAGTALGLAALTVRALQAEAWTASAIVAAFTVFFVWRGGTFLRRNRPARYAPDSLPQELLPKPR
jgi:hypothetical protein